MDDVKAQKKALRKEMGTLLAAIDNDQIQKESSTVVHKLIDSDLLKNAKTVSIYVSTSGEICTDELISHCIVGGKCLYIPRFKKGVKRMEMLRLNSVDEFRQLDQTLWGIRQHAADAVVTAFEEDEPCSDAGLDLVVMPGVAFTAAGKRLGHGMGFYDQFLHEHQQRFGRMPKTVALALTAQLVDDLPTVDGRDVTVDRVLHA